MRADVIATPLTSASFPDFYEREYAALARYAWVLVRDRETAHDITQEAFTRLLSRWVKVREPRPYLFQVVTNLARATWRQSARQLDTVHALQVLHDEAAPAGTDLGLRAAVAALPERLRDPVLLFYFADLPLTEVARAVRRPEGTVKRQLSEARALLAAALSDDRKDR